jgi:hypothetical protein
MVDSILVSVDFSNKNDTGVMVVGRKRMNQSRLSMLSREMKRENFMKSW